ncbi:Uu.00g015950.m01.CDS01 [Anthostomella pinea]|uniref:Uu.00g015950.m01.CDS01 n=1 Tax=Anthostomella pinea TaxID=933095 RepID=A0AAI8YQJ4_9PEZI|nr:Uu.00g015950.m01.CDS01 [Anthostomella pinea]
MTPLDLRFRGHLHELSDGRAATYPTNSLRIDSAQTECLWDALAAEEVLTNQGGAEDGTPTDSRSTF